MALAASAGFDPLELGLQLGFGHVTNASGLLSIAHKLGVDTAQARACARTIAGWKPLPVPLRTVRQPSRQDP